MNDLITEMDIVDAILGLPRGFKIGDNRFYIYPVTLGKSYLLARLVSSLEMDVEKLRINPYMEAIRLCNTKKDIVCRILSYHTMEHKEDISNIDLVNERCELFKKELDNESMAQLLVMVLSDDDFSKFIKHLGIDKEKELQSKAFKAKDNGNSFTFGGKSVYGTLIDSACERYGWTFEYVVWEISLVNLRLLLADTITSIYLSDDEIKNSHIRRRSNIINADDPASIEKIKSMNWD